MAWSLPQHELPGKAPLSASELYARRERVFLVLASVFVVASTLLPLLGFTKLFGASALVRRIGLAPPAPLLVPLGAFAFPLALLALNMIATLYGTRRAQSLVLVAIVPWLGVLGLHWATDHIVAYDKTTTTQFLPGVALAACVLVTCTVQLAAFAVLRRVRAIRAVVPALLGIAAGWAAAAALVENVPIRIGERVLGVALAAGGYTWLAVIAGSVLIAIIAPGLATYLRFALRESAADDLDPASSEPAFTSRNRW